MRMIGHSRQDNNVKESIVGIVKRKGLALMT